MSAFSALRRTRTKISASATALAMTAVGSTMIFGGSVSAESRRVAFANFSSCPKLMAYLQSQALATVGPNGIGSVGTQPFPGGAVIRTTTVARRSTKKATTSGTPNTEAASLARPATTAAPAVAAAPAAPVEATPSFTDGAAAGGTSTTNVQEVGVDEGDEVETDGRYVYSAIGQGGVRIVDTTTGAVAANIPNYGNGAEPQLILDGTRLAVTRTLYDQYGPETIVELWSVLNPTRPELLNRTHLEGNALAVRSVNHRARIVLTTAIGARIPRIEPASGSSRDFDRATTANRAYVKRAKVIDWLPRIYDESPTGQIGPVRQALDCREIGKPADPSGLGLVWVATLDLDTAGSRIGARGSGGVVTNGGTVYSSAGTLYVATMKWQFGGPIVLPAATTGGVARVARPQGNVATTTYLHAFDLSPADGATYLASGSVRGNLLNQFSMSEFAGVLRVATTTPNEGFGTRQESAVHLLVRDGRSLTEISSVGGLGRNELIYGVRFLGELGYVVTFRQTDPLYVLDLRNPRAPRVAGELKIPGYSAYLHPMQPGYLLAVGQDATDAGRRLGSMLQVFDVRDPNNPQQVAKLRVGGSSEAEYNHHAFLWWPESADAIVPNQNYEPSTGQVFSGLVVANVTTSRITERGRIVHEMPFPGGSGVGQPGIAIAPTVSPIPPATTAQIPPVTAVVRPPQVFQDQIRRALIVSGKLVSVSNGAVKVSELGSLQQRFFTTFQ